MNLQPPTEIGTPQKSISIKVFGVGTTGVKVIEQMIAGGLPATAFIAINAPYDLLKVSSAAGNFRIETNMLRGLGTGGDPERGRTAAEEHSQKLKSLCEGADVVFIVAGLGGGTGTGISPVLARIAKEAGALVLAFVTTPFDCEGSRRKDLADEGFENLKAAADGVVCLPNQKIFKLIDEDASVLEAFKTTNDLLTEGARGVWRLLTQPGLIEIHFEDLCALIRGQHVQSAFATAEAFGLTRSREVTDKILAHPLFEGGEMLADSEAVLVSLMGGPDLTMAEVNRVMEEISSRCKHAQVIMGAAIDEAFRERLAVTLIASRTNGAPEEKHRRPFGRDPLPLHLLEKAPVARPGSRFVPPAPALPPQEMEQLLARQGRGPSRARKTSSKLRQTQLPLEIVSKGRFDKSEPTIHKGEDLDVPTYIRRGVALN